MSVNLPESGWHAELAIRYPVASHDRRLRESKDEEMGAVSVATMVVSWLANGSVLNGRATATRPEATPGRSSEYLEASRRCMVRT